MWIVLFSFAIASFFFYMWRSDKEYAEVLRVLRLAVRPLYGLEIVKQSPWITRGGIYVTLGQLEADGLVCSREEEEPLGYAAIDGKLVRRLRRRLYWLKSRTAELAMEKR